MSRLNGDEFILALSVLKYLKGIQVITYRPSAQFDKQAALILLDQGQVSKKHFPFSHADIKNEIISLIQANQFSGVEGELFPLVIGRKMCLLAGVGKKAGLSLTALRVNVRKALLSPFLASIKTIEVVACEQKDDVINAIIEAVLIGTYAWRKYRSENKDDKTVYDKDIFLVTTRKKVYEDTVRVCAGVNLTRDLVNDNADTVTSEYVEKTIRGLVKGKKNLSIEVLNKNALKQKGLGLHLAVNQGSIKEPKLIIIKYRGSFKDDGYTAIIGKGMTFDAGGLNLKPSGHIETMRTDMSGAAAVVGVLKNTLSLKLKKNIVFACAMAENVVDAASYKPGDVIKGYAGKTVEVANTDAEGRLVLADAISYVSKNYKPSRIIDIATLTGACVIALGHDYTGLVSNDDKFSHRLIHASRVTDDRLWQLPVYPELKEAVKSQIADLRNLGFPKGAAGTITAAEFLRQFVGKIPWAHLDIAGTAFVSGDSRMYFGHGATGAGVRVLTHFLRYI